MAVGAWLIHRIACAMFGHGPFARAWIGGCEAPVCAACGRIFHR